MSKRDKQEYDGVYYGNRKNQGAEYLFNPVDKKDYEIKGIRGKDGFMIREPGFDSAGYANAVAASAATGSWMKKIKTDDNASRKAEGPMAELADAGLSFEEIDSIMKRTGQKVLDSDNDVDKDLDEYDRMHNLGKYKNSGRDDNNKPNEGSFKPVDYSEDEDYQEAKERLDADKDTSLIVSVLLAPLMISKNHLKQSVLKSALYLIVTIKTIQ